jgi:hypothetical protein
MSKSTVLTLVGSLRADSHNKKLAEAIQLNAPENVDVQIHGSLGTIPFYNEDIDVEGQVPAEAAALRAAAADARAQTRGDHPAAPEIRWHRRQARAGPAQLQRSRQAAAE